jgi:MSHA biogenesis protein MshO
VVGILAGIVAVFIRNPIAGYLAAVRRAEMVDIADTALGRIARDVRSALPNSVRVTFFGGAYFLEFLPVEDGGRYRAEAAGDGSGDILDFRDGADHSFDVLGPPIHARAGQYLVIYNLGLSADTDAWQGGNRRSITSNGSVNNLAFTATGAPFPLESPDRRFFLVGAPVSYVCDPASHTLRRFWGYAPSGVQPLVFNTGSNALLATRVKNCSFTYEPGATQRMGQLTLWLQLENTEGDQPESVSLYQEVGVDNEA